MLRALQIENYALIRSLDIQFDEGFTVITGETGAGKSILMGALSLILGSRAETDVLYDKSRKCIVEGTFDTTGLPLEPFFEQNDLDHNVLTTIRREINEHGKSRAFINDTPVTLTTLKELTSTLIDIHSQHQNLLLQNSQFRLDILDQYAQNQQQRTNYRNALAQLKQVSQQHLQVKEQCAQAALQQEFNNYTVQELDNAQLQAGEQEATEQSIQLLSHAEDIKSHLYSAAQQLSEQEDNTIIQQLKSVQSECHAVQQMGPEFQDIASRLDAVIVELKDLAYEIVRKENEIEVNPKELERLNERIDLIYSLQHKYQVDKIQDLLNLSDRLKKELGQYTDNQELLEQLEKQRQVLHDKAQLAAEKLSASRKDAISKFQKEVEERLHQLGMPDSSFQIVITNRTEMQSTGIDDVQFQFSANRGIVPADLSKIASGGEMSRIMLALKSIISDTTLLPTVIFDEIDTGISGDTANKVAAVMGLLSEQHQVIAITHLPQIAARGDQHFLVYKKTIDGKAVTNLRSLNDEERIDAIAGILGGIEITESARTTARELLNDKKTHSRK